mmetsp:Transcript_10711/g.18182  ORF Transcript_10711/g.18182 Transcript_10711/m.18182 type:complete len:101 (-) Transcript_10711:106-408(-)
MRSFPTGLLTRQRITSGCWLSRRRTACCLPFRQASLKAFVTAAESTRVEVDPASLLTPSGDLAWCPLLNLRALRNQMRMLQKEKACKCTLFEPPSLPTPG